MSRNKTHEFSIHHYGPFSAGMYFARDPYTGSRTILFPDNIVHSILPNDARVICGMPMPENGGQQCTKCGKFRDDVQFYDEIENTSRPICDHCVKEQ